ncbi:hypothetical protein crov371 [Cafeteria roenbergensis virus]|uniref:Uncharacterized protein n=1 Tax=Cafeteria roenbergensis virus (strain BV-PW1) TaxID=693272 RepID=E3T5E2_CROVB|nr:hypothetical protein crov371 [Cafeteria roenbergensis virus BV-PW1]ADO67405.1 hypothetical protein crov371 [Cafeteria roenbergensis virus BV-PW1]
MLKPEQKHTNPCDWGYYKDNTNIKLFTKDDCSLLDGKWYNDECLKKRRWNF